MRGLDGRVAVVTGGAGGIGAAVSRRLAAEGTQVMIGDLAGQAAAALAAEIGSQGHQARGVQVDVSSEESVQDLFNSAVEAFGGVDILVTVAANMSMEVLGRDSDAVDVPLELFEPTMQTNLLGTLLCVRQAVPLLLQRGGGPIVCTSSAAAFLGEPERVLYGASKAGINSVVRHTASRWGKEGIRANAVAPGLVPPSEDAANSDLGRRIASEIRSPRLGRPEDVASLTAFLVSDEAEWINGQIISVDGGWLLR